MAPINAGVETGGGEAECRRSQVPEWEVRRSHSNSE